LAINAPAAAPIAGTAQLDAIADAANGAAAAMIFPYFSVL
jgi:hypothetical protein